MRITTPLFLTFAVLPATVFALTIQPHAYYSDVRSSSPAAAGINLLTDEGIVQGYSDHRFRFSRLINRAEFLKIVMKASAQNDENFPFTYCFQDVTSSDWFSPFVCAAQQKGIVDGKGGHSIANDRFFAPADTVTYGEALKMLTVAFGYDIPLLETGHWAEPFYRAAALRQVDLPITINLDSPLTRSLAARLTAAFFAESKGQLSTLRFAEAGEYFLAIPSSKSSSSIASSVSSSSSSASSSSSVTNSLPLFTLPSVSHFLIAGQASDAIADLTLQQSGGPARIVSARVKLVSEVSALSTIDLVNALDGTVIMTLRQRTTTDTTDYKLTYEAALDLPQQVRIPAGKDVRLVLRANIRGIDNSGASDQLLQLRTFSVTVHRETSNETVNIPALAPFPKHQTAFGRITSVVRTSPANGTLASSTGVIISAFSFSGSALNGRSLAVEQLTFTVTKSGPLTVRNWHLQQPSSSVSVACTTSQDSITLTCPNLGSMGDLPSSSSLILELRADTWIPVGASGIGLQADLAAAGSPSDFGSIQWTDQSGHFRWIEGSSPVAKGTKWQ